MMVEEKNVSNIVRNEEYFVFLANKLTFVPKTSLKHGNFEKRCFPFLHTLSC